MVQVEATGGAEKEDKTVNSIFHFSIWINCNRNSEAVL
jgi:hypothetical protein